MTETQVVVDRRLVLVGFATLAFAVAATVANLLDVLPRGWAAGLVLVTGAVGLRVLFSTVGRLASVAQRQRVLAIVSSVGLALSAVAVAMSLVVLTRNGGWGVFGADALAQLWVLVPLTLVAVAAGTMGLQAGLGMLFIGFLALPSLARVVGSPVLDALDETNVLGHSVWIPVSENLILMLPVAAVALLAVRRSAPRPTALGVMLLGAVAGAGFALHENASYGRGGLNLSVAPPLSWLFPTAHGGDTLGTWWFGSGHLVAAALIGLGVGVSLLYRGRFRVAVWAAPLALVVTVAEHSLNNLIASQSDTPATTVLQIVTARGTLSSFLLIAGVLWCAQLEVGRIDMTREDAR